MENIITRLIPLPASVKAMVVLDSEGDYNIYVNNQLSYETQVKSYKHEMRHIENNDFCNDEDIRLIENRANEEVI